MPLEDLAKELGVSPTPVGKPGVSSRQEFPEVEVEATAEPAEADAGSEAGEEFLAAIRSNDPEELVLAFKSLMRAAKTPTFAPEEE